MPAPPQTHAPLDNIQALRGLAVLLVLVFHLHELEAHYVSGPRFLPDFAAIGRCGVDLFFAISGAVMVLSTRGRFGLAGETARFALRRALRIYPLYWFYSALTLSVYLLPATAVGPGWVDVDFGASFLLWPQEKPPLLLVGWTLWHELYFYAVFALFLLGSAAGLARNLGIWALLTAAAGVAYWTWFNPPAVSILRLATDPLTFEFIGGALLGLWWCRGNGRRGGPVLLGSGLALWGLAAAIYPDSLSASVPDRWIRVLCLGIPALLVLYGALILERAGKILPRWLVWTGTVSYSIYLSHLLVLSVGRRLWLWVVPQGYLGTGGFLDRADNALALLVLTALCLAVGGMSHALLERPLHAAARRLTRRLA